jgi:hypothetical protein
MVIIAGIQLSFIENKFKILYQHGNTTLFEETIRITT